VSIFAFGILERIEPAPAAGGKFPERPSVAKLQVL
jgi:hypothetical protein